MQEITRESIIESFGATPREVLWATEHADEFPEPLAGTNEDGETTMVEVCREFVTVETFQSNGWVRVCYYHRDGTCEETYKHE